MEFRDIYMRIGHLPRVDRDSLARHAYVDFGWGERERGENDACGSR